MSFGSNTGAAATQTVQQLDPRLFERWDEVNSYAKNLAAQDDPFYNGPTHAADNTLYRDARSTIAQAQGAGQGATADAANVYSQIANQSPFFFDAAQTGDVLDVVADRASAGSVAGGSLAPYMNQYQGAVIDQSNRELDRQQQMVDDRNAYAATQAGAFGGSRHGILDAENARNFAQMKQDNTNSLLQSGYGQAQGLLQSDIDRQAALSQFNTGQTNAAMTGNADRDIMARNADAERRQAAAIANAGIDAQNTGFNLQAAQGLLGAGQQQQSLYLNQAQALAGAGDQMRASQQAEYDNARDKWDAQFNEGDRDLARLLQPFGILPSTANGSTGSTNSTAKSKGVSL